jgi:hypothetical protein
MIMPLMTQGWFGSVRSSRLRNPQTSECRANDVPQQQFQPGTLGCYDLRVIRWHAVAQDCGARLRESADVSQHRALDQRQFGPSPRAQWGDASRPSMLAEASAGRSPHDTVSDAMLRRLFVVLGLLGAFACSGEAEVGEECDTAGSTDECVGGAVCTNDSGGRRCRRVCNDDTQCAASEACNGVSGTNIKSCQPKNK